MKDLDPPLGVLGDLGSLAVDLCTYLVGPVSDVTALTSTVHTRRPILPMGSGTHFAVIEGGEQGDVENEDYVAALLQGYEDKAPAGFNLPEGSYYNRYFPGHAIKMPKPLNDGQVTYDDGSPATVAQYAKDVTTFLMWAAEPHMEARKALGLQVFVFLILLTVLLYFTKKKVWANAH